MGGSGEAWKQLEDWQELTSCLSYFSVAVTKKHPTKAA